MQSKSPLLFILFSIPLGIGIIGCTPPPPATVGLSRPLAGKTVRVACPGDPSAAVVRAYSRSWANREGASVEVIAYDPAVGPEQQATAADIWVMSPAALPKRAAASLLLPLPQSITGSENSFSWMDLLPLYRERLLIWDRISYAVPLMGESPLCIYRQDLFDDPARQADFQKEYGRKLTPPTTWEEFAELAEFFRNKTAGGTTSSLSPLPSEDLGLDREFFTLAACYARRAMPEDEKARDDKADQLFSFQYDHHTGNPRVATPGFIYTLNLLRRLQKCRSSDSSITPVEAFRQGRVVLALADVSQLIAIQQTPGMHDKTGICRMPGGESYFDYTTGKRTLTSEGNRVPYLGAGGWLAAVSKSAAEPNAAFSLLADLAGPERSSQIVIDPSYGGGPTRRNHLDRIRWDGFGLDPERTKSLKDALVQTLQHPAMLNPAIRLRTPEEATHEAALMKEIRAFLTKDESNATKALTAVVESWEEMDRVKGPVKTLADYRISVGLLPGKE